MSAGDGSRSDRRAELFHRALELAPEQGAAWLDQACGDDHELRREVEALLRCDRAAPAGFLPEGAPRDGQAGARIGAYELVERLGEGGMGTVYAARQSFPRRDVALKVIRRGRLSPAALTRFQKEVQALGSLQHPGIAQIYDAGVVLVPEQDGRDGAAGAQREEPYIAMELVRGKPLLEYASLHGLSVRERLELVARTADAVHHAHQRGVIHRDLKPDNVLVVPDETRSATAEEWSRVGQPKVLDFGIARLAGQADSPETKAGELVGTLAYMSPEQLAGDREAIDERSDVWALGVLAYQLLGGRLPFDLAGASIPEVLRILETRRPTPLGERDPRLRGDVSTIVARALAQDRDHRYGSAAELADDLRRHLRGAPIRARSDSALYVLQRRLRRHRGPLGAGLAIAGLVAVAAFAWRERERGVQALGAQSQESLERALDSIAFLTLLSQRELGQAGPSAEQRELLQESLAVQRRLLAAPPGPGAGPQERLQLALARKRAGAIQESLGQGDSIADFEAALRELRALEAQGLDCAVERAGVLEQLALALARRGRLAEALACTDQALAVPDLSVSLRCMLMRGKSRALHALGDPAAAEVLLSEAVALADANRDGVDLRTMWSLKITLASLRQQLGLDGARTAELFAEVQETFASEDAARDPLLDNARVYVAVNRADMLQAEGELEAAEQTLREAIAIAEDLVRRFPSNLEYHRQLFGAAHNLGALLGNQPERAAEALPFFERALRSAELLCERAPEVLDHRVFRGLCLYHLGAFHEDHAQWQAGLERLTRAIEDLQAVASVARDHAQVTVNLRRARTRLAWCLLGLERHREAVEELAGLPTLTDPGELEVTLAALAEAAAQARVDPSLAGENGRALAEEYVRKACQALASAMDAGFRDAGAFASPESFGDLGQDRDFAALFALLER